MTMTSQDARKIVYKDFDILQKHLVALARASNKVDKDEVDVLAVAFIKSHLIPYMDQAKERLLQALAADMQALDRRLKQVEHALGIATS